MKLIVIAAMSMLSHSLFAQKKDTLLVLPGSKYLQSSRLHEYTASYDFFSVKEGEEKLVGGLEDRFQRFKGDGLRVCKITFGQNNIIDSGLCRLKGLVPVYHRSNQTKKNLDLKFSKEKVSGKITDKDEARTAAIDHATPAPLFDSYYEDVIAMTVNIKQGILFRFPEYIYEKGGTVWSLGEILKGENTTKRIVKFYELGTNKQVVRTTTYNINESTREIVSREYQMGSNRIIMKKRQS